VEHFIEGRENVHDDPRSGRPSVVNEDLVCAVEEKVLREHTIHHFITFPAHSVFGQKTCSACGILASRLNSQRTGI
jgi:hypothetical protein